MTPVLKVSDLTVSYERGDYVVKPLDGFCLEADAGELVLLLGPSGCGKTTLISCLGGILCPDSGSIRVGDTEVTAIDGTELTAYRREGVGIAFQSFNLIPSLTAIENVAAPLLIAGASRSRAFDRARTLLERVDLADRVGHRPGALSAGQQQRVAIARALAGDPPVLVADEPTASLDHIQAETVIRLLRELARPPRLVVVSTHDDRLVPIADRVVELVPRFRADAAPPHEVRFSSGQTIFEQGQRGELVYVIESGEVDVIRVHPDGSEEPLATVGPGEYFGELSPLLGFPRSATTRARTDIVATAMGAHLFRDRFLQRADQAALSQADGTPSHT